MICVLADLYSSFFAAERYQKCFLILYVIIQGIFERKNYRVGEETLDLRKIKTGIRMFRNFLVKNY